MNNNKKYDNNNIKTVGQEMTSQGYDMTKEELIQKMQQEDSLEKQNLVEIGKNSNNIPKYALEEIRSLFSSKKNKRSGKMDQNRDLLVSSSSSNFNNNNSNKPQISEIYLQNTSTREDVINLKNWVSRSMTELFTETELEVDQIVQHSQIIYNACIKQLVRQVAIQCVDRGQLLENIFDSYQLLFKKILEEKNKKEEDTENDFYQYISKTHRVYLLKLQEMDEKYAKLSIEQNDLQKQYQQNLESLQYLKQKCQHYQSTLQQRENDLEEASRMNQVQQIEINNLNQLIEYNTTNNLQKLEQQEKYIQTLEEGVSRVEGGAALKSQHSRSARSLTPSQSMILGEKSTHGNEIQIQQVFEDKPLGMDGGFPFKITGEFVSFQNGQLIRKEVDKKQTKTETASDGSDSDRQKKQNKRRARQQYRNTGAGDDGEEEEISEDEGFRMINSSTDMEDFVFYYQYFFCKTKGIQIATGTIEMDCQTDVTMYHMNLIQADGAFSGRQGDENEQEHEDENGNSSPSSNSPQGSQNRKIKKFGLQGYDKATQTMYQINEEFKPFLYDFFKEIGTKDGLSHERNQSLYSAIQSFDKLQESKIEVDINGQAIKEQKNKFSSEIKHHTANNNHENKEESQSQNKQKENFADLDYATTDNKFNKFQELYEELMQDVSVSPNFQRELNKFLNYFMKARQFYQINIAARDGELNQYQTLLNQVNAQLQEVKGKIENDQFQTESQRHIIIDEIENRLRETHHLKEKASKYQQEFIRYRQQNQNFKNLIREISSLSNQEQQELIYKPTPSNFDGYNQNQKVNRDNRVLDNSFEQRMGSFPQDKNLGPNGEQETQEGGIGNGGSIGGGPGELQNNNGQNFLGEKGGERSRSKQQQLTTQLTQKSPTVSSQKNNPKKSIISINTTSNRLNNPAKQVSPQSTNQKEEMTRSQISDPQQTNRDAKSPSQYTVAPQIPTNNNNSSTTATIISNAGTTTNLNNININNASPNNNRENKTTTLQLPTSPTSATPSINNIKSSNQLQTPRDGIKSRNSMLQSNNSDSYFIKEGASSQRNSEANFLNPITKERDKLLKLLTTMAEEKQENDLDISKSDDDGGGDTEQGPSAIQRLKLFQMQLGEGMVGTTNQEKKPSTQIQEFQMSKLKQKENVVSPNAESASKIRNKVIQKHKLTPITKCSVSQNNLLQFISAVYIDKIKIPINSQNPLYIIAYDNQLKKYGLKKVAEPKLEIFFQSIYCNLNNTKIVIFAKFLNLIDSTFENEEFQFYINTAQSLDDVGNGITLLNNFNDQVFVPLVEIYFCH